MRGFITYSLIGCFCFLFVFTTKGQDIHFSQYFDAPLQLNPAFTGQFNEDYRVIGNYRNQWSSVTKPYSTFAASGDLSLFKGKFSKDYMGAGIAVYNDIAGDSDFRTTSVAISYAYHLALNKYLSHYLSFGFQTAFTQKSINQSKLLFDSQISDIGFDPNLPNGENIPNSSIGYPDFNFGINWFYQNRYKTMTLFSGIALHHFTEPNQSFYNSALQIPLYRRLATHLGTNIAVNDYNEMSFRMLYNRQGPYQEMLLGAQYTYIVDPREEQPTRFSFASYYRVKDALIVIGGVEFSGFKVGLSYDINLSKLTRASNGSGGPEISLQYKGFFSGKRTARSNICPRF